MGWNHDPDAFHSHQSGEISALTEKTTPHADDLLLGEDSENSGAKVGIKVGNLGGGGGGPHIVPFSWSGALEVSSGGPRLVFPVDATLVSVVASCGVAPNGDDVVIDVNLNGTTIFTTQSNRPTVPDGDNQSPAATPDVTEVSAGDYLTVDIDQIGSTDPGEDLTVTVVWSN